MKVFWIFWFTAFIICGILLGFNVISSTTPKVTHPTFTQHQQLELRVERLEKIVGLKGEEMRKEGIQHKIK